MKRRRHRVTAEERKVYADALARDGGCVAPRLDQYVDECDGWITRQHVREHPGQRRITDLRHVLILCSHHHLDGWATTRFAMSLQRAYLGLRATP